MTNKQSELWRWVAGILAAIVISGGAALWASQGEDSKIKERLARIETMLESLAKRLDEEIRYHHKD
jgi:predicted regulator of Ras-like GTPase activity (Roadblock/LC7/MglB family)